MKTRLISSEITRRSLGEIATIQRDAIAPTQIRSGTIYVGLENVTSSGEFTNVSAVSAGDLASTKFHFSRQHILYGKLRPYLSKIARPDFDGVCSTDILPILPSSAVDKNYLFHYLRTPEMVDQATTRSIGANLPRLSPQQLAEFEIPLPPLAEQRRISDILDKADGIRRKRREANTIQNRLRVSVFVDLFGDPGANSRRWPYRIVGELLNQQRGGTRCGPFGTALKKSEYLSAGIPVWGIENVAPDQFNHEGSLFIAKEKYEQLKSYCVEDGDLLISRAGSVGRVCVARPTTRDSIIGTNLIRVSLNHDVLRPEYLSSLLTYFASRIGSLRVSSDADAYSFMKTSVLERLRIPVPPIAQQDKYVAFLSAQSIKSQVQALATDTCESLFDSLVQQAFRGKL
jgi:type I restriction enzyme S subunit